MAKLLNNIDWEQLRVQKEQLIDVVDEHPTLSGLVHLIDSIQDYAVDSGIASEEQVFGIQTNFE